MPYWLTELFRFNISLRDGELSFYAGWGFIAVVVALIWWVVG